MLAANGTAELPRMRAFGGEEAWLERRRRRRLQPIGAATAVAAAAAAVVAGGLLGRLGTRSNLYLPDTSRPTASTK